jgi:hypothetical protein
MTRSTHTVLVATLLAITFVVPAAATDSLDIAQSVFQAEKNNQKHPAMLTHTVTANLPVVKPRLCIAYENTFRRSSGKGVANIQVMRVDGTEESFRLVDRVRDNSYVKCTRAGEVDDLAIGDMVVFEMDFQNMLRLKRHEDQIDRVEINSIVVADGFPLPLGTVGAAPGEEEDGKPGGWMIHSGNHNFQAARDRQEHHDTATKRVVVPYDVEAPQLCSLYRNSFDKARKGKVLTEITVERGEEIVQSHSFSARVRKNTAKKCKAGETLLAGDIVTFNFTFDGFPVLKKSKDKVDYVEASGVVSGNGKPDFVTLSTAGPSDPTDPNPGPTPPPPASGGLSSADLGAAGRLLIGNKPVQLWRAKTSWGRGKWWAIGPKTKIDTTQLGNVIASSVGMGDTIAAAVADYERKQGRLPGTGTLSNADVNMLVWYNGINSDGGPTSVRKSPSGGFYGEYYRPGKGAHHKGPYSSPAKALEWLRSQGL